jgi:hypothetical protein
MAMFNFSLDGKEQVAKPMRSKLEFDANGKATATIYADEYDLVKNIPDFQDRISAAGRNMAMAQDNDAYQMQEARIADVEKRIKAKRQETIRAETEAREAQAEDNAYSGPDFLGSIGGLRKTFTEKATSRQEELRKMFEERAGYMGIPEISAPMPQAEERVEPTEQAAATQAAPTEKYVRVKGPQGKTGKYPKSAWEKNSRNLIEQGYILLP